MVNHVFRFSCLHGDPTETPLVLTNGSFSDQTEPTLLPITSSAKNFFGLKNKTTIYCPLNQAPTDSPDRRVRLVYVSPGMSDAAIMELNLPTGIPIVYELDADLKPVKPMAFLGDEETVKKAMEAVAAQGKAKK